MESRLKKTHHLFKWCCQLKAVFIAVYWLSILGNLNFYLNSESENGYGQLSKGLHCINISYQTIDFYCKYMFTCRQVKYNRLKISENLLGKCISNLLARGQLDWKSRQQLIAGGREGCGEGGVVKGRLWGSGSNTNTVVALLHWKEECGALPWKIGAL